MTGRPVGRAHPDASAAPSRQLKRRRTSKDRDAVLTERVANHPPSNAGEGHNERLERQIQALEAKLAISELERLAERQTAENTIQSLRAINEALSRSLAVALDSKPVATAGIRPMDRLDSEPVATVGIPPVGGFDERVVRWDGPEADWDDTDVSEHGARRSLTKWILKVLRAASPI